MRIPDRAEQVQKVNRQLRNSRDRLRGNCRKADMALASFDQRVGSILDLLDYERFAERAQLNALEIAHNEAMLRVLLPGEHESR